MDFLGRFEKRLSRGFLFVSDLRLWGKLKIPSRYLACNQGGEQSWSQADFCLRGAQSSKLKLWFFACFFPFPLPCSLFNVMAENSIVVLNAWRLGMAFLCLLLFYILVSCFGWCASPFIDLEWHDFVSYEEYLILLCLVLTRSGTVQPVQHHSSLNLLAMRNTWPCFGWFSLV